MRLNYKRKFCGFYGEGLVMKCFKIDLQGFVLKISCVTMLYNLQDQMRLIIKSRHCQRIINAIAQEMANILGIFKSSIENHLHKLDYVSHFNVWP